VRLPKKWIREAKEEDIGLSLYRFSSEEGFDTLRTISHPHPCAKLLRGPLDSLCPG